MAYLGNQPVVGDSANTFKALDDITTFTVTFDATSSDVVSIANDTLTFNDHRFVTGQKVTYNDGGGTAIGGLADGSYFIIKQDQNTIKLASSASNAAAGTAINLTSGAAGSSHTLNIAFDGINTKFKATHSDGTKADISRAAQLSLSINGVIQQPQDTTTPTVGYGIQPDSTIVFSTAPQNGDKAFGSFIGEAAASFDIADNTVDEFTGDGSTTAFTLSKEIPSNSDALVTVNGVVQHPTTAAATRAYSTTDNTITFTSAPSNGAIIQVRHIGFAGASSQSVTGFYGRDGNVSLRSSDNISVGLATATSIKVGTGITLSSDGDVFATGIVTATSFVGSGSGLTGVASTDNIRTNTNATFLQNINVSGTSTVAGTSTANLFSGSGASLTNLNASNIASGTVPTARLGSGTASSSTFLRGDSTFATVTSVGGDTGVDFNDNVKARFGTGNDLEIYHDGGGSIIKDAGTGDLRIGGDGDLLIMNAALDETKAKFSSNGAVELYHDNSKKFETTSTGVQLFDNSKLVVGTGGDGEFYHDANHTYLKDVGTGNLRLASDSTIVIQKNTGGETIANFTPDGAVELYYDNSKKFETTSSGSKFTGKLAALDGSGSAGSWIALGDSDDLKLYHNGTDSYIDNGTGNFYIRGVDEKWLYIQAKSGEESIICKDDGAVELYYDNTKKFETTSGGSKVSGDLDVVGHAFPNANNTYDLGTSGNRWRNLYINDLQLSNEAKKDTGGNDVDGTWGNYTIQEGESDLFLINNRSGKKYKFNLTEVS